MLPDSFTQRAMEGVGEGLSTYNYYTTVVG